MAAVGLLGHKWSAVLRHAELQGRTDSMCRDRWKKITKPQALPSQPRDARETPPRHSAHQATRPRCALLSRSAPRSTPPPLPCSPAAGLARAASPGPPRPLHPAGRPRLVHPSRVRQDAVSLPQVRRVQGTRLRPLCRVCAAGAPPRRAATAAAAACSAASAISGRAVARAASAAARSLARPSVWAAPPSGVRFAAPGHAGAVSAASGLHFALLHAARDALRGEGLLASALPVHPEVAVHDPPRAEAGEGDPATAVGRPRADAGGEAERRCRRAVGPQDERERERGRG